MLMEFKTARNTYGHRRYLGIDTENRTFTTNCPKMITEGAELKTKDYRNLIEQLQREGYKEI